MIYTTIPQYSEEINEVLNVLSTSRTRGTKEYWLNNAAARTLPTFLRCLNYYFFVNDLALYIPNSERITRSTGLNYYFDRLTDKTGPVQEYHSEYFSPLGYTKTQLDTLAFKSFNGIHIISVEGQIRDVFENKIPSWANNNAATELLGVSLALKITPKHRVRVYKRGAHIIIFTTQGMLNRSENDYKFLRKVWACLPILCDWIDAEGHTDYFDIITLCKALDNDDATTFWNTLIECFKNNPVITDLKYAAIISTFKNMSVVKINHFNQKIMDCNDEAERYLTDFRNALTNKRSFEEQLLAFQQTDAELDPTVIKQMVDKHICYSLNIDQLAGSNKISYRCSAPLLTYDKNAAEVVFKKRVQPGCGAAVQRLFKLLFIDEKVILNFDEAIDIHLSNSTIQAQQGCTRYGNDLDTCLPNPHHYYYNCWGNYAPIIIKLINEFKLEEMFYQIKAAVSSFNFTDYPVVGRLLECLENITELCYTPLCFYWRDEGCTTLHTFEETIKHFTEEETE